MAAPPATGRASPRGSKASGTSTEGNPGDMKKRKKSLRNAERIDELGTNTSMDSRKSQSAYSKDGQNEEAKSSRIEDEKLKKQDSPATLAAKKLFKKRASKVAKLMETGTETAADETEKYWDSRLRGLKADPEKKEAQVPQLSEKQGKKGTLPQGVAAPGPVRVDLKPGAKEATISSAFWKMYRRVIASKCGICGERGQYTLRNGVWERLSDIFIRLPLPRSSIRLPHCKIQRIGTSDKCSPEKSA